MRKRIRFIFFAFIVLLLALAGYVGAICGGWRGRTVDTMVGSRRKTVDLYYLKGTIYDKELRPLTNGRQQYYLLIDPRGFVRENTEYIAAISDTSVDELGERLTKETAFVLTSDEKPKECDGVYVFEGVERYQGVANHLIGYVNGELSGMTGLEKSYDETLSYFGGEKKLTYSTDARRNLMAGLGITLSGEDGNYKNGLITTLDLDIQLLLQQAMKNHVDKGAGVVLDAQSGEILAMYSLPDFDATKVETYLEGTEGELINRALSAQTVGSVFKVVVATAAFEQKLDDFQFVCNGSITVDDRSFACPTDYGHGKMDLKEAFAQSCNGYFIALGQMMGSEKLLECAKRLGFGESMEIARGLFSEQGKLPQVVGESARQIANVSIGQGDLMATPLQIARLMAVCGNGGYLVKPTCFQGYLVDGEVKSEQWIGYRQRVIDESTASSLRELCLYTVTNGTGTTAQPDQYGAGGKTSSAQTGKFNGEKEVLNTYFAGFYPASSPKYAIAVFAEDGVSGSKTCAPVFKEVCDGIARLNM